MNPTKNEEKSFFELSSRAARSRITDDVQKNIMWKNPYLRTLAVQNKLGFRETYYRARTWDILELYALVSPTYTNNQELSDDPDYFTQQSQWLESRVPKKLNASIEAIRLLWKYFAFRINIVVADTGLLLSQDYSNSQDLWEAIWTTETLYQKRVSELLPETPIATTRLSKLLWQKSDVVTMSYTPTRADCEKIIRKNVTDPTQLLNNLWILITAFWITVAYFELQAYFEESRLIWDTVWRSIILNIEWTSVWNKLLTKWIWNLCVDRIGSSEERVQRKWWNLLIGWTVTL